MNLGPERRLLGWLSERDPGAPPARLRAAVAEVPYSVKPDAWPALDGVLGRVVGPWSPARAAGLLVVLLAAILAVAGTVVLQPWRPFPPPGWLAYTAPTGASGSSGITLATADGSATRQVSSNLPNVYDHSPRWSRDGRTLLFARTTQLDSLSACGGVGSVVLYDVATGAERVIATGLRPMNVIDWSPSGDKVAYTYPPPGCGTQVELGVVDLRTGEVTTKVVVPQASEVSASAVLWHVAWTGDEASAVPDSVESTTNGRDFTTTIDVPSHDGKSSIRFQATSPERVPALTAISGATNAPIDLGSGGVPAWSPDDTAIVYIQPGPDAGSDAVNDNRDHLVIATAGTWQTRVLAEILMPDPVSPDILPTVAWTGDGSAVYWNDPTGFRVIDVVTGRSAGLPALPPGCTVVWQPH